mmetsp:Transcript_955/g.3243  ORF Transcript_955/g.3243 Transcript_955/m.3243 type:complete len:461 (-) Transcript_955:1991-3373(-)
MMVVCFEVLFTLALVVLPASAASTPASRSSTLPWGTSPLVLGIEMWTVETRETWHRIASLVAKLRQQRPKRRAPEVVDALLLWQYGLASEKKTGRPPQKRRRGVACRHSQAQRAFVRFCWRCASSTYGSPMLPGVSPCPELITVSKPLHKVDAKVPAFFVGYGDFGVVVAIRGTADPGDVGLNLICDAKTIDAKGRLKAHEGIADAADRVAAEARDSIVQALKSAPKGSPLVLTGHSLGAAAALLCASVADLGDDVERQLRKGKHPVRAVAFAPPPVVSRDASSPFRLRSFQRARRPRQRTTTGRRRRKRRPNGTVLESYFVENDVVPDLSFASVADFARKLDDLDAALAPRTRVELLLRRAVAVGTKSKEDLDASLVRMVDAALAPSSRQQRALEPALTLPGTVFRLDRRGGNCVRVKGRHHPEIRIHRASFIDHFLPTIDAAIDAWVLSSSSSSSSAS